VTYFASRFFAVIDDGFMDCNGRVVYNHWMVLYHNYLKSCIASGSYNEGQTA